MHCSSANKSTLLLLAVLYVVSAARADTKLLLGATRGYPGLTVSVPVILTVSSNSSLRPVALQADILFDPALLTSGPATLGARSGNHTLDSSEPEAGLRRVLLYSPDNSLLSNGIIANVPFTIPLGTRASAIPLRLANVILATSLAEAVIPATASGLIIINPVFVRPDGDVNFFFEVLPDHHYLIQASSTLTNWLTLSTNTAATSYIDFIDTDAHTFPFRFYRLLPFP